MQSSIGTHLVFPRRSPGGFAPGLANSESNGYPIVNKTNGVDREGDCSLLKGWKHPLGPRRAAAAPRVLSGAQRSLYCFELLHVSLNQHDLRKPAAGFVAQKDLM
ncbi:hypothetical protein [Sinorhizobium mexicanum]|uniref:hypothetical protein n=1 Tax=Sinorhizobium mexicanum TaxID=375549 RepID=UPI0015DFF576|nr:hypothetical protein [Sinorhizobium mexicanum]MBP1885803.1 hypothetical protein [Sinorhizobium mexicanum]